MNDKLIDVFCLCYSYLDSYSSFITCKLKDNLNEYINGSISKKNRYFDNLISNLNKIKDKEIKSYDNKLFNLYISKIKDIIDLDIESIYITDVLIEMLEDYNKSLINNKNKKYKKPFIYKNDDIQIDIELPKLKDNGLLLKNKKGINERFFNISYDSGKKMYVFDQRLFDLEFEKYINSINANEELLFEDLIDISSFEKKRRKYIYSMLELEKKLNVLSTKEVNITTSLEIYFIISKQIVDEFYNDIVNNKSFDYVFLNELYRHTINTYGPKRQIENYKNVVNRFVDMYNKVPSYVSKELLVESYSLKSRNDYREFRDISCIVPMRIDIINAINKRISDELVNNVVSYIKNIDEILSKFTCFMSIDDVVLLYFNIRNSLSRNSIEYSVNLKSFVRLQKSICILICDKLFKEPTESNLLLMCEAYLKERALFK